MTKKMAVALVKDDPAYVSLCKECVAYKKCDYTTHMRCTATYELSRLYESVKKVHPVQRPVYQSIVPK